MTQSDKHYAEQIVATISQPIVILTGELKVEIVNRAFCHAFKVKDGEAEGRLLSELGNGEWDIPELRRLLHEVLSKNNEVTDYRVEHTFERTGRKIMCLNARRMPRADSRDRILLAIDDITKVEEQRHKLEGSKEFAEKLVDSIRESLLILGWDLRVHSANQSFYDHFQVTREETQGKLIYELGSGQWDIPEPRELLEKILPEASTFNDFEVEHDFQKIGTRTMLLNGRRLDHLNLIILAIRDVTEQRNQERRQQAFMGELQHRVKNILNNVGSLARQTRRGSTDFDQFFNAFMSRLVALARAQELLVRAPEEEVELADIVHVEPEAIGAEHGRTYSADGPSVRLSPRDTQAVAMALHELATNAGKYGALKVKGGFVEIEWRRQADGEEELQFHWREHGVSIADTQAARGFGSEVIEKSVPYMLGGSAELVLARTARNAALPFPFPKGTTFMTGFLDGRHILVLEDDYLLALDVQQTIEDFGGTVVGPVGRLEQAQALARAQMPDVAVLDVNLDGSTSYPLARELLAAGVAVIFLTGYEASSIEPEFADVPRLSKPFDQREGERVFRNLIGAA